MNEYEKQANNFLKVTGTEITTKYLKHGLHFEDDKHSRDIYRVTIKKGNREYCFDFGQSLNNSGFKLVNTNTNQAVKYKFDAEAQKYANRDKHKFRWFIEYKIGSLGCYKIIDPQEPTVYDILSCLNIDDSINFNDFCLNYGYKNDSIKALNIYKKVQNESNELLKLYSDKEIKLLSEVV